MAFHDASAETFEDLDEKLLATKRDVWGGRDLPFPVLLDASGATIKEWAIEAFPTTVLIDPRGNIVKGNAEQRLERMLKSARKKAAESDSGER